MTCSVNQGQSQSTLCQIQFLIKNLHQLALECTVSKIVKWVLEIHVPRYVITIITNVKQPVELYETQQIKQVNIWIHGQCQCLLLGYKENDHAYKVSE